MDRTKSTGGSELGWENHREVIGVRLPCDLPSQLSLAALHGVALSLPQFCRRIDGEMHTERVSVVCSQGVGRWMAQRWGPSILTSMPMASSQWHGSPAVSPDRIGSPRMGHAPQAASGG